MSETVTIYTPPVLFPLTPSPDSLVELRLHEKFNELKARMLNLAETVTADTRQCNAVKGLMKDFLNQAYYGSVRAVNQDLMDRGFIPPGIGHAPIMGINAKSLADIQVE